jgi:SAM-dependent methyltransferase
MELVSGARHYWGDYLKFQVDKQFYSRMVDLQDVMITGDAGRAYDAWFEAEPEAAALYTTAQHNGSLATARAMFKRLDLTSSTRRFLDVGGGSGAFAIALCRGNSNSKATVLDLPNVVKTAEQIIGAEPAEIAARISTKGLSASFEWGVDDAAFDVVNMSYISGSVPAAVIPDLYRRAYQALEPGGCLVVHDFMVDNSQTGPLNSALWALAHVSVNPEGAGLRPALISEAMVAAGFVAPRVQEMIGELTKVVVATKPH